MPKSHESEASDAGKNPEPKRAYNKPVLSRYGQVKDLTTSGSVGMMEMGMSPDQTGKRS